MIRFENVSKIYSGQERPALDNVNLEIAKGEFVFLVGLSGSGKSTFLRLVLREERPTTGIIHVAGKDLNSLTNHKVPELRRQVGTVFQDFRLLPNKPYNGHKNWTQWNVSLWINNDEYLYSIARNACLAYPKARGAAIRHILRRLKDEGITQTPDGAKYSETALRAACVDIV